jgi:hypothetical protein
MTAAQFAADLSGIPSDFLLITWAYWVAIRMNNQRTEPPAEED